jgi:hypothetical protein
VRKDLVRDNRVQNKKLKNAAMPFFVRWQDRVTNNRKKTALFLAMLGVL